MNRKRNGMTRRALRIFAALLCLALLPAAALGEAPAEMRLWEAGYPDIPRDPMLDITPEVYADEALYEEYMSRKDVVAAFEGLDEARQRRRSAVIPERDALDRYVQASAQALLSERDGNNKVYSPVNLWLALCMLSELTEGSCRGQILSALGADSEEALLAQAEALCLSQYWDDGFSACVPGASLWLNRGLTLSPALMERLSRCCFADVFSGNLGDEALNAALRDWLNARTNGLLADSVRSVGLTEEMSLALFSTMYFRARWFDEFSDSDTCDQVFHAPQGDVQRPFMHVSSQDSVYTGRRFSAIVREMHGGSVVFCLPGEGLAPEALLADGEVYRLLSEYPDWEAETCLVNLSVPRLDCSVDMSFTEGIERLGVVDLFRDAGLELSGDVQADGPVFAPEINQTSRIVVDEQGVEAASILTMPMYGACIPEREIDFTLDRPFLMFVLGEQQVPLFIGVINCP